MKKCRCILNATDDPDYGSTFNCGFPYFVIDQVYYYTTEKGVSDELEYFVYYNSERAEVFYQDDSVFSDLAPIFSKFFIDVTLERKQKLKKINRNERKR